jgi:hypothetical protein
MIPFIDCVSKSEEFVLRSSVSPKVTGTECPYAEIFIGNARLSVVCSTSIRMLQ